MRRGPARISWAYDDPDGSSVPAGLAKPSRQPVDEVGDRHPRTGVERHLLAHVPARTGGTQVTHQVHDAVQLVGLERQDPLVVTQREAGDGVGPDVLVLP